MIRRLLGQALRAAGAALTGALMMTGAAAQAQTVSVNFTLGGYIGTVGSNTGQADVIVDFANIGITSAIFEQASTTGQFGGTQGNDYCGTLTLIYQGSTQFQFPVCVNWRITTQGDLDYIGFIPDPNGSLTPRTFPYYGTYQGGGGGYQNFIFANFYDIDTTSNFALRTSATAQTYTDGTSISGNAAASQALAALNAFAFPATPGGSEVPSATVNSVLVNADATAAEDGTDSGTILFKLDTAPTADVTVSFSEPTGQCSFSPSQLTFDTVHWADAQEVTVTAVDDGDIEGNHTCIPTVSYSSNDQVYDQLADEQLTLVSVTDNDTAGYTELPSATINNVQMTADATLSEDGSDTGTILFALNAAPTQDVTVTFADAVGGRCSFSPSPLTFTAQNWADAQAVEVTAIDDSIIEGGHFCIPQVSFTSADQNYQLQDANLTLLTITDDDIPGYNLPPSATINNSTVTQDLTASEDGDTATFLFKLTAEPGQPVDVSFTNQSGAECTYSPFIISFGANDWDQPQAITVTATDDILVEGAHSCTPVANFTSQDPNYQLSSAALGQIAITDNEVVGYETPQSATINNETVTADATASEDRTDTGTILFALTSQPTQNVTVSFADASGSECFYSVSPVVFTPQDWADPQVITVYANDDSIIEGDHTCTPVASFQSQDQDYANLAPATLAPITITDNDSPGFIEPTFASIGGEAVQPYPFTAEDGSVTGILLLALTAAPTADVSVTLSDANGQCTYSPAQLTFDTVHYADAQVITVTAVDDAVAEGTQNCEPVAVFSSADPGYQALGSNPLSTLSIVDNDDFGYVTPPTGTVDGNPVTADDTASESGDTAMILFGITSAPTAAVTVTFFDFGDPQANCSFSPESVTFDETNWADLIAITVSAIDDGRIEGDHTCTLKAGFVSDDPMYGDMGFPDLADILITDNDAAGATSPDEAVIDGATVTADTTAGEDGDPARLLMVLDAEPRELVEVTFTDINGQCTFTPNPISFGAHGWDQAQAVTVDAIDDDATEETQTCRPVASFSSADPDFDGLQLPLAEIAVIDNDDPEILVTETDLSATEGGGTAALGFALTAVPTDVVVLTFSGDDQCTISPDTVILGPDDMATLQDITITATDDDVTEGEHLCQPTVTVTSADARYDGMAVSLPAIAILDDRVDQVREPLTAILQDDLEQTMARQSAAFAGISRGALGRLTDGDDGTGCGTVVAPDVDGSIEAEGGTIDAQGTFEEETLDCVRGERRLVWGEFALTRNDEIGTQGMVSFGLARERETETEIRGWFWGGYASRYTVDGQGATGEIDGLGLNGGLYGARELEEGLTADYYAALAGGLHRFDLDFDGLVATGDYTWVGAFAGVAVSGEMVFPRYVLRPRAGLDAGYAVANDPAVTVTEGVIEETGTLVLDPAVGLRLYVEAGFLLDSTPGDAGGLIDEVFEITPRVFCETGFGSDEQSCGWGLAVDYTRSDLGTGIDWTVGLAHEATDLVTRTSLRIAREQTILNGAGTVSTGLDVTAEGAPVVSQNVTLQW